MSWEPAEIVDQVETFCSVDLDHISVALPVCREYNDGFGLHLLCDVAANGLELAVDRICLMEPSQSL